MNSMFGYPQNSVWTSLRQLCLRKAEQTHTKALTALCYALSDRLEQARTLLDEIAIEQTVSPYARGTIHAQLGPRNLSSVGRRLLCWKLCQPLQRLASSGDG